MVVATDMHLVLTNIPPPPLGTNRGPSWHEKIKKISGGPWLQGGNGHWTLTWASFCGFASPLVGKISDWVVGSYLYMYSSSMHDSYVPSSDIHPISRNRLEKKIDAKFG